MTSAATGTVCNGSGEPADYGLWVDRRPERVIVRAAARLPDGRGVGVAVVITEPNPTAATVDLAIVDARSAVLAALESKEDI